jgi:hypothetical protein
VAGSASAAASAPFSDAVAGFFFRFLPPREPRRVFFLGLAASVGGESADARPEHPACGGGRPLLLLFYLFDWSST